MAPISQCKSVCLQWATHPYRICLLPSSLPLKFHFLSLSHFLTLLKPHSFPAIPRTHQGTLYLGPFPCFPLPGKQVLQISKWLTSSPSFLKPCGMNGRGCSEKTPNGHFLMDVPQACPTRTSSSPSTLKLLLLMWSSSQGVALFHTSLLLTWHSSCAIDYYVLCLLNMSPNHSPLLTLLHSLSPSYHGLPLHYWYGLSTGLHISNLPPHPPTRFLHPASIFQVDWSPL